MILIDSTLQTGTVFTKCVKKAKTKGADVVKLIVVVDNDMLDKLRYKQRGVNDVEKLKREGHIVSLYNMNDLYKIRFGDQETFEPPVAQGTLQKDLQLKREGQTLHKQQ